MYYRFRSALSDLAEDYLLCGSYFHGNGNLVNLNRNKSVLIERMNGVLYSIVTAFKAQSFLRKPREFYSACRPDC